MRVCAFCATCTVVVPCLCRYKGCCLAQAVVVTDPYLISDVLSKETEIEKSIEGVYSKFNVVSPQAQNISMSAAAIPI